MFYMYTFEVGGVVKLVILIMNRVTLRVTLIEGKESKISELAPFEMPIGELNPGWSYGKECLR